MNIEDRHEYANLQRISVYKLLFALLTDKNNPPICWGQYSIFTGWDISLWVAKEVYQKQVNEDE